MGRTTVAWILLILILCLEAAPAVHAARTAPVGWWKFDGNAEDSSGNDNDGTLAGNPQWVTGKFSGALDFDGVDDHVTCGNGASLNITGPMTISAWVYPTGAGSGTLPRIVDKSNGTGGADPGYKLYFRPTDRYIFTLSAGGTYFNSTRTLTLNTWNYVAFVITGTQWKLYVNDASEQWNQSALPSVSSRALFIGDSPSGGRTFDGLLDDVRLYDKALTEEEIGEVKLGPRAPGVTAKPIPADSTADVPRDVTLSWTPGEGIATHDVYFGSSRADVNDAGRSSPRGVLVSQGQAASTYRPTSLAFGQTYYWRVDGVGTGAGATTFKGDVWSFTVEPYVYRLQNVTATACDAQKGMGPENTVNGSGLNAADEHSVVPEEMWLTLGVQPNWIQYKFDQAYKLHELWVWNSNQLVESFVGFGAQKVAVESSLDGNTWTALTGVPEFARAPGTAGYAHNTTVSCGDVLAQYVKLTINSTWGGIPQAGLSEVRFFYLPVQARAPVPGDAATGVKLDAVLGWRPGREAASHKVYFGKDREAVASGTAPAVTVAAHSFTPAALDFGATYYWRVDEVNEARVPGVYQGSVWSFDTEKYAVVDDFESYTDQEGGEVFAAWVDGYGTKTNGAQVGKLTAANGTFCETSIVHGDKQSMPLFFNNAAGIASSEAELTLTPPQNWTAGGAKTLSLWFYGDPNNKAAQFYVKVNGVKVAYDGDPGDLVVAGWRPWNISLASFGTNLQKVATLTLGVEGSGAAGRFFFDDIRLYPRERQLITPTEPNATGLVAYYKLEKDATDSSGNKNHGTVYGNPPWVAGKVGNAIKLDGGHDYIDCGNSPSLNLTGPMTIVAWMQPTGPGGGSYGRLLDKSSGTNATDPGYKIYHRATENYIMTLSVGGGDRRSSTGLVLNNWNFFAFVATGTQWKLCLNGAWEEWEETHLPTVVENPLYLGNGSSAERYFQGLLDEVRIYNRALTAGEIAWLSGRTKPFDLPL